jgi:hypothetical protein
LKVKYLIFGTIGILWVSCSNDPSSSAPVVSTEKWSLSVPSSSDSGSIEIMKHSDSSTTCTGNWYYEFFDYPITCKIMSGSVIKDTSFLSLICTGTAAYPPDSSGKVESSPFTLNISGNFKNGKASGDWQISFSDTVWNEWAPDPGKFTGKLQSGTGITN